MSYKNLIIVLIGILGFGGVAFALPYYQQTQGLIPGVTDAYYIGTSSPSTLEYNGIFTKNLTISGTCTGCGGSSGNTGNVATSTAETIGQLSYWTSTAATPATLGKVATSSFPSFTGPFIVPTTLGALVGGSGSITYTGLSTTSQPAISNLLVSNGAAGVFGVGTSTPSIGSVISYTGTLGNFVGGVSGTFGITNNAVTYAMRQQVSANRLLGNATGAAANEAEVATSTLFGTPTPGNILAFLSGQNTYVSTTTLNIGGNAATVTTNANLTGVVTSTGNATVYPNANANTVLANATGASAAPSFVATSTFFGTGSGGQVLMWSNATNGPVFAATSSASSAFPFTVTNNYGAVANSTSTPIWFTAGLQASTTANYFAGLTVDNAAAGDALTQYGATNHEWVTGAKISDFTFRISSSTTLGTSDALTIDKNLKVSIVGSLSIASLTGALSASAGAVTAGTLSIANGGTGSTTAPISQLLYGGATSYQSVATSSLTATGLLSISNSPSIIGSAGAVLTLPLTKGNFIVGNDAGTAQATSTIFISSTGNVGISSSTPYAKLSIGTGLASSTAVVAEYRYGSPNQATSTAANIDCATSNQQHWPMGISATTLTLTNLIPGQKCLVIVENPNAAAGALTWAAGSGYTLLWPGGTTPSQTTTANKMDVWSFLLTQASSTKIIIGAQSANF